MKKSKNPKTSKSIVSILMVLMLLGVSMIGITAGNYNDYKYDNIEGYETTFESELPAHPDLDETRRGFLNVTYFQTSGFTTEGLAGEVGPTGNFWSPINGEFVKDVDGNETGGTTFSANSADGRIYVIEQFNEVCDISNQGPYGKKAIIRGFIVPTEDFEELTIGTRSDDGTIVTIDGIKIIDNWVYQAPTTNSAVISKEFKAGSIHTITVEYFENRASHVALHFLVNGEKAPGNWFYPYKEQEPTPQYNVGVAVYPGDESFGSVTPIGTTAYSLNDSVNVVATPKAGYHFVKWWSNFVDSENEKSGLKPITDINSATALFSVDGSVESAIDTSIQVMNQVGNGADTILYAEFEPNQIIPPTPTPTYYTLTVNVVGEGTVPGFEGTHSFSSGTNVNLEALIGNTSVKFDGWTGDINSLNEKENILLTSNKVVTATFSEIVIEEPTKEEPEVIIDEQISEEVTPVVETVVLEELPQDDALPQASGTPLEVFTLLGISIVAFGAIIRKKSN